MWLQGELRRISNALTRQNDLVLVALIVLVVGMMVMPLPTFLMDIMITLNMSVAIIIMLVSIHLHTPLQFSTFPAVLLISTLFRLAISISTTRLILIQGDAGSVIRTFGEIVIGGNLVVGLVIFLIITVVQFLVITKGADRVAEVSARFTLDGLPGKQMSVDAELRAGMIDQIDAGVRRKALEQETKLFGAMDGAMKFVKGDAVAGLVIAAINLIGGIIIGMGQRGMSFADAINVYSLMTVGDGLVSQIPALMIAIASGTIVTRVTSDVERDLGSDITRQLSGNDRTLVIGGVIIVFFGFVPGFPFLIFGFIGGAMVAGVMLRRWRARVSEGASAMDWAAFLDRHNALCNEIERRTNAPPSLTLILPRDIIYCDFEYFGNEFEKLKEEVLACYGLPQGYWRYEMTDRNDDKFQVVIHNQFVAEEIFRSEQLFVRAHMSYLVAVGVDCITAYPDQDGAFVHERYRDRLEELGFNFEDSISIMLRFVRSSIVDNLGLFVGVKEASSLIANVEKYNPTLISDLNNNISLSQISVILKRVIEENVPLSSVVQIFETILEWAPKEPNPLVVVEKIRTAIGPSIIRHITDDGFLPVAIVAPSLENKMRDSLRSTQHESFLILNPDLAEAILANVADVFNASENVHAKPVLITHADVRRYVHRFLSERGLKVPVVSYQEVPPNIIIYPVAFIHVDFEEEEAAA